MTVLRFPQGTGWVATRSMNQILSLRALSFHTVWVVPREFKKIPEGRMEHLKVWQDVHPNSVLLSAVEDLLKDLRVGRHPSMGVINHIQPPP